MIIGNGQFLNGDSLELMRDIPSGSVDMVLCDLPYGTTACSWDTIIPFEPLWEQYWRVCKPNAAVVLTASQPFTTALISSQIKFFKYEWIWEKEQSHTALNSKFQPLKVHENICVFSKSASTYSSKMQMQYFPQMNGGKPYKSSKIKNGKHSFHGSIDVSENRKNDGTRFPRSVQLFYRERGFHPTQKPVALFEYLIKTYTNEGETVLDNTAGSGTTAIAAERTGRRWICMEKDPSYYYAACGRVWAEINS
jgi:site-specific DNA-methyltransferase (adenine-specific)